MQMVPQFLNVLARKWYLPFPLTFHRSKVITWSHLTVRKPGVTLPACSEKRGRTRSWTEKARADMGCQRQSHWSHIIRYTDHSGMNKSAFTILRLSRSKTRTYHIPDFVQQKRTRPTKLSLGLCYRAYPVSGSKMNQIVGLSKAT